jgi:hypothetical protein
MTRHQKIMAIKAEIENYERQRNFEIFYPLPKHLKELINLFTVDNSENTDFIEYVNKEPIDGVKWCLEECKDGYGQNDWWINCTIRQIKEHSVVAIRNFYTACRWFKVNCLDDEMVFAPGF